MLAFLTGSVWRDGAGEYDPFAACGRRIGADVLCALDVRLVVFVRLVPWLPVHRRKVENQIGRWKEVRRERLSDVMRDERDAAIFQRFHELRRVRRLPRGQEIDKQNVLELRQLQKPLGHVRSNEARASEDDNFHRCSPQS